MARGSGKRRTLKNNAAKVVKEAEVTKPAVRQTRSQSLKENQEIEIQFPVPTNEKAENALCNFVDDTVNRGSREGSADSAISSNSSKWSLYSNVSFISRMSKCAVTRRLTQTLEPVTEDIILKTEGDVNPDTINWVNGLSSDRGPTATPLVRTHAVADGHLTKRTVSHVTDSSNSDSGYDCQMFEESFSTYKFRSEAVIHLHIYVLWALMLSTEHHVTLMSKSDSKQILAVHPVALQVAVSFFLGILCDLTSPKVVLLGPQVMCALLGMLVHFSPSTNPAQLVLYLPFLNSSLLGFVFIQDVLRPRKGNLSFHQDLSFLQSIWVEDTVKQQYCQESVLVMVWPPLCVHLL
ncbi:uncharacterized protein LOC121869933 [Homarus americanus]|uniref:uncharacterized protein LOC121869933 n=1 Tax=Homarus americanus TaxID=6706 RepID=UPI001C46CEC2|nr:uncharacterized protein LOC121869933 [Homarus americanus]